MKNNLRVWNPLIYHKEFLIAFYGEDSPHAAGQKIKFNREEKSMEYSRGNKKAKPKVEMHDPLKNHSTNGIWKVKPYLHFKDMEIFCNFNTSDLSKYDKVCTLDTFQQCFSPSY